MTSAEMSDYHSRVFRAQLTTTMDTLLRTAVFEISKVFDGCIYDHQVELVQKTEEITRLQRKLLRAESKLREGRGMRQEETITIDDDDEEEEVEEQPSSDHVPEIVVEVPDDWCTAVGPDEAPVAPPDEAPVAPPDEAPVAPPDEAPDEVAIQEDNPPCPSVSLRPLSVSLWRIPNIKREIENDDFESHLLTSLKEDSMNTQRSCRSKLELSQSLNLPTRLRHRPDRELPPSNRVENLDKQTNNIVVKRRVGRPSKADKMAESSTTQMSSSRVKGDENMIYSCKFCSKVFNTEFGLSVHVRSHKKCTICQKMFPFPSSLRLHMQACRKVKNERAPKKENEKAPENERAPKKEKSTQNLESPNKDAPTTSTEASPKKVSLKACHDCGMKFPHIWALRIHRAQLHNITIDNKRFHCKICRQKFPRKSLLKNHLFKVHGKQKYGETNGDLSWMKPLEDIVDSQEASSVSQQKQMPSTDIQSNPIARKRKKREDRKLLIEDWRAKGKEVSGGFSCLQCKKVISSKFLLMEHYRIHTGEMPLSCEGCGKRFRCHSLKSFHRKKCAGVSLDFAHVCKHCGKEFINAKCYQKHCARYNH